MSDEHEDVLEILKCGRNYASYYEWPDKRRKELGIVETFVEALRASGDTRFGSPRSHSNKNHPPDCVAEGPGGQRVGIEVTEVVDEDAVRMNQQAHATEDRVWRFWKPEHVCRRVDELISQKDSAEFHDGPYALRLLVIHCDEPHINSPGFDLNPLRHKKPAVTSQIDEAYLLLSYHPDPMAGEGYHPLLRLPVVKQC
jgi:hypothetical protein